MGSNTGDVINKVKCPLLAVPENAKYERAREIAFTTDFKITYTSRMLNALKEMATLNGAAVHMLNI